MTSAIQVRCSASSKRTGKPCNNWAIKGGTVCRLHGGSAPQVKAKAGVVAELRNWGLTDEYVDPSEALLKLVAQSSRRAQRYAEAMEAKVDELGLERAMVGDAWGEHGKTGEYIKGLAVMEAQERDRLANFAAKAVGAGLAERQVRLAERQGEAMMTAVSNALKRMSLTPDQAAQFRKELAYEVRALGA